MTRLSYRDPEASYEKASAAARDAAHDAWEAEQAEADWWDTERARIRAEERAALTEVTPLSVPVAEPVDHGCAACLTEPPEPTKPFCATCATKTRKKRAKASKVIGAIRALVADGAVMSDIGPATVYDHLYDPDAEENISVNTIKSYFRQNKLKKNQN